MAITRERQVFIALMLVAGTGLILDRVILGPGSAAAETLPEQSVGAVEAGLAETAKAAATRLTARAVASLFPEIEAGRMPALAFGPSPSWTGDEMDILEAVAWESQDAEAPPAAAVPVAPARWKLSLVMPTSTGGVAVINGQRMQVGQWHPEGFRLIHVGDRSVVIEHEGRTVNLALPSPGG